LVLLDTGGDDHQTLQPTDNLNESHGLLPGSDDAKVERILCGILDGTIPELIKGGNRIEKPPFEHINI